MANKKTVLHIAIIFLMTLFSSEAVFSQSTGFVQRLEWQKEKNAFEYIVEIQSLDNSSITKSITTTEEFVEFSMPAGKYRYRVSTLDFLGRKASVTEWNNFTITKALQPKVDIGETSITVEKNKKQNVTLPVNVESITDETTISFINIETSEKIEGKINFEKDSKGSVFSKSVVFPAVSEGEWKMVVKNPSGLYTESETVAVVPTDKKLVIGKTSVVQKEQEKIKVSENDEKKNIEELAKAEEQKKKEAEKKEEIKVVEEIAEEPVVKEKKPYVIQDINLLAGGISPYAMYDDFFRQLDGNGFNYGGCVRLSWLPVDIKAFKLGFETNFSLSFIGFSNDFVKFFMPVYLGQFNLVGRYNFANGKFGLNIKAGAGVSILKKDVSYIGIPGASSDKNYYGYICAQGGLSVDWIPAKHFIVEAGADFTNIFMPDMNAGLIVPYVALGVRF